MGSKYHKKILFGFETESLVVEVYEVVFCACIKHVKKNMLNALLKKNERTPG